MPAWDWTPALTIARSGFFETDAWPLVRMPAPMVEDVVVAAVTSTAGRLEAITIAATATVATTHSATDTATTRSDEDKFRDLLLASETTPQVRT